MKADLADIYAQLDLRPDCSLEEFQYAYRRRVAQLHPDRHGGQLPPEMQDTLGTLIALHASVCDFHRRHGRMPGALPAPGPEQLPVVVAPEWPQQERAPKRSRPLRTTLTLAALFIALIALLASWSWLSSRAGSGRGASADLHSGATVLAALTSRRVGTAPPRPSAAGSSCRTAGPDS
ncbi:J domain-containing protein [Marilutibacter maris]|uniref:J domain-containing protein n=1 Tax=Marilutibacter maris TaxID=1605891 RepID=UPI0011AE224A|nr:J domain-containing protein [Lysobacter maris]